MKAVEEKGIVGNHCYFQNNSTIIVGDSLLIAVSLVVIRFSGFLSKFSSSSMLALPFPPNRCIRPSLPQILFISMIG
jgi:hypothetical protein